jgi:aminodeoxyfutalosine synthase
MSLFKIEKKVLADKRLSPDDALALLNSNDLFTIGRLAGHVSIKKNGNRAFFIQNHHINPTNICVNRCKFCAFSRSKGEKGAYELSIKEIIKKLRVQTRIPASNGRRTTDNGSRSFSEVHIVGGLHPDRSFGYYCDMMSSIKKTFPALHIKAFTAVEIDYFSRISGLSIGDTLLELKNAGLGSMPGGGAEIFNTRVRNRICPEKISGRRWLQVMETAHTIGIKSNATMLYGHLETNRHRVAHMLKLRDLQDRTTGFQAFIPLAFHPLNTNIDGAAYTSGIDDIMTIAVSRLFLDNIPHIKAYWIMLGEKIAQLALLFGADDLDGTIIEEKITHAAGRLSEHAMTQHELVTLIRKSGREPVERDSYYNVVQRY